VPWLKLLVGACALTCWISLALIYWEVESVLGTGPVVLILGGITAYVAKTRERHRLMMLGLLHVVCALVFFWCVQIFSWSPSEATEPFKWMGRIYAAGWTVALLLVLRPDPEPVAPDWDEALGHVTGAPPKR
jgi:hypothetical protein